MLPESKSAESHYVIRKFGRVLYLIFLLLSSFFCFCFWRFKKRREKHPGFYTGFVHILRSNLSFTSLALRLLYSSRDLHLEASSLLLLLLSFNPFISSVSASPSLHSLPLTHSPTKTKTSSVEKRDYCPFSLVRHCWEPLSLFLCLHRSLAVIFVQFLDNFLGIARPNASSCLLTRMQKQKMLLKDFLREDPRPHSSDIEAATLLRSRSRKIPALETMINAFKNIAFGSSVNKPYSMIFLGSLSRKLSAQRLPKKSRKDDGNGGGGEQAKMTVKIKDIIRWTSFRDLAEERSWPSDFRSSPPHQCSSATTVTTTGSSSSTESNSNGSSWCESDFTLEFSPPWNGNFQEYSEPCVGKSTVEALPGPKTRSFCDIERKRVSFYEEEEQHSPVSVIDAEFGENEGFCWSRDQSRGNTLTEDAQFLLRQPWQFESVAYVQSSTSMGDIDERSDEEEDDEFREEQGDSNEPTEQKAKMLLNQVKASSSGLSMKTNVDNLLLDYFINELATPGCDATNDDSELMMVSTAKSWMNNELSAKCEWGINSKKDSYLREMDRGEKWRKFEEEKEEMALYVEAKIMGNLVDELLSDFILN